MEKSNCIHAPVCLVGGIGPGCSQEESLTCGEALKRAKLAAKPCPLMADKRGCDNSQLRGYVPSGADCYRGEECLMRIIVPETAGKVAASNGIGEPLKISPEELKKAGRTIINSMSSTRAKPAAEKVAV